ncbi:hypothetical protein CaCOL14_005098 [Colletotrichum acutatum]
MVKRFCPFLGGGQMWGELVLTRKGRISPSWRATTPQPADTSSIRDRCRGLWVTTLVASHAVAQCQATLRLGSR